MSADEVLDYFTTSANGNKTRNRDRIFALYTDDDQSVAATADDITGSSPLKVNTKIAIPNEKVFKETLAVVGKNQLYPQGDFKMFLSTMHRLLLEHSGYERVDRNKDKSLGVVKQEYPNITVWMWVRALSDADPNPDPIESRDPQGKFIDVSPFIFNCDTNVDDNGGNFTINLSAVPVEGDKEQWTVEDSSILNYHDNDIRNNSIVETALHKISRKASSVGELERRNFLFHHLIQQNDMVFIRYETLEGESAQRLKDSRKLFLSPQDIPGRAYDMIGLVDSTSIATNPESNDVTCTITGRDLVKTIIDDGSYFYATPAHDLSGLDQGDGLVQRLTANGKYPIIAEYAYRSIAWSLQFLMNQIAGIQVVPDDTFYGYGNRRVRKYKLEGDELDGVGSYTPTFEDEPAAGVWQIIRLSVDSSVASRRVTDQSFAYPDGSLISQFWKLCQKPFVEFYTDTYGDQFFFMVRQPPHTGEHINNLLYGQLEDTVYEDESNEIGNPNNPEAGASAIKPKNAAFSTGGFTFFKVGETAEFELDSITATLRTKKIIS